MNTHGGAHTPNPIFVQQIPHIRFCTKL